MSNPEKPDFNKPALPSVENELQQRYENRNISFLTEGAKNNFQTEIAKSIIDAMAPYTDTKVLVQYKAIKPENAGFNSRLNPEFRDEDYYDSITINSNYQYQVEIPFFLLHELGHSLEEKLVQIINSQGMGALPVGLDDEYADFYADLITVYILKPELLSRLESIPRGRNTVSAIQEMFQHHDFAEFRKKLAEITGQTAGPDAGNSIESEGGLTKLFERVFDKIREYIK